MSNKCFSCRFRFDPEVGGCSHSPDRANPIRGNATDDCAFIKMEGRSRWQEKPNPYGRIYYPDGDQPHYPPGAGEIRSGTPEPTGYSLVCRQSPDGLGSIRFLTKDGKVYNPETKKYMGKLEDFQPQKPTEEELEQATRWLKEKFKIP